MKPEDYVRTERMQIEACLCVLLSEYEDGATKSEPSIRLLLLFSSLLKLRQQAKAALMLSEEVCVEEILSISRTMAEVAINAAYLQFADDQEIDRYKHFDTQSLYKHSAKLRPHTTVPPNQEEQTKLDEVVALARAKTNRKDTDPTWSINNLAQRAEYSDKKSSIELMLILFLTVYANGHQAVHGTITSVRPFYQALETTVVPRTEERLQDLGLALHAVNFVLYIFGLFVNSLLHLGKERDLIEAGKLQSPTVPVP